MSFLNIRGASRGLNSTVNADAISLHFGLCFEVREVHARVAIWLPRLGPALQDPGPALQDPRGGWCLRVL